MVLQPAEDEEMIGHQPNPTRPWKSEDEARLIELATSVADLVLMARKLKRSEADIRARMKYLNWNSRNSPENGKPHKLG